MKKYLFIIVAVALLVSGFFLYRHFTKSETKILETAKVTKGNLRGVIVETGIIKPQVGALVKIGARATGTIEQMYVKIGDRVKKGQPVALSLNYFVTDCFTFTINRRIERLSRRSAG